MIKRKWVFGLMGCIGIVWVGVFAGAEYVQHRLNHRHPAVAAHDMTDSSDLTVLWDSPAFSFPDQDGQTITNRDLLGHAWVADFIYTQCTSACPVMTSKMVLIQKQVQQPSVRFVSFSVDPEHDTPAALKNYVHLWQGDESRWRLLSTTPAGLANVAAGMNVQVAAGNQENPILHSNLFMLVDAVGKVRGVYDSSDNDAMARLIEDIRTLAGNQTNTVLNPAGVNPSGVERGRVLYGSMGCLACHSQPRVAPPLQGVYGSMVRLDNKRMVWADEAYLHESIVDPGAKIVAGYTRSMPSYQNYLDNQQVLDLVNYILSLSSNQPGGHGLISTVAPTQPDADELLTDPVCKMQVRRDPSAPHLVFNGKTYYFCSDHCREQFLKNPGGYAAGDAKSP